MTPVRILTPNFFRATALLRNMTSAPQHRISTCPKNLNKSAAYRGLESHLLLLAMRQIRLRTNSPTIAPAHVGPLLAAPDSRCILSVGTDPSSCHGFNIDERHRTASEM